MGNASRFHHACAVAALAVLTAGCDDMPRTWSRSELVQIAADNGSPFQASFYQDQSERIQKLEIENGQADARIALLTARITDLERRHDSLRDTVNHNADVANQNVRIANQNAAMR